jgi:hypothetical protein
MTRHGTILLAALLVAVPAALAGCSSTPAGSGTVVGMIANNGGPALPNGGQACGGGGPSHPNYHLCLTSGTITFASGGHSHTVDTTTGRFHIDLPTGTYAVTSPCEHTSVVVSTGKSTTLDLWCQIP